MISRIDNIYTATAFVPLTPTAGAGALLFLEDKS
jgi:hypothetical protein